MKRVFFFQLITALTVGLAASGPVSAQQYGKDYTSVVSRGTYTGALESDGASINARTSKNGRFIVFESTASNLVTGTQTSLTLVPGRRYVYLFDRQANSLEMVSLTFLGRPADADSFDPSVSADGRYVAFTTSATLAEGSANSMVGVCSDDWCHVNKVYAGHHVYVRDRLANETMLIDQVTLPCKQQDIDAETFAPKVEDDTANPGRKMPVLVTKNKRISSKILPNLSAISANPRITADGRFVVYDTDADNLVLGNIDPAYSYPPGSTIPDAGEYDTATGIMNPPDFIIEPDAYYGDGNGVRDVYVRDGSSYSNNLLSLSCKYHEPNLCAIQGTLDSTNPTISDDGGVVTFQTQTPFLSLDFNNKQDVFAVQRSSINGEVATLTRVSNDTSHLLASNGDSTSPAISGDGRFVVFQSTGTNVVTGDTNGKTDIFVWDKKFNSTLRCSSHTSGGATAIQSNGDSIEPDISGSGEFVSFQSNATVFGATSGVANAYVAKVNRNKQGQLVNCSVELASSASGSGSDQVVSRTGVAMVPFTDMSSGVAVRSLRASVTYQTAASGVTSATDTNGQLDIFQAPVCSARDLTTDTDGDGTNDCFDQCWKDASKVEDVDSDADGSTDCEDGCANDPQKNIPGLCGCGVADTDVDYDGTPDCKDSCPFDPNKAAPGVCGCGQIDQDLNGNGTMDCKDIAGPTPTPTPTATPTGTLPPNTTPTPVPSAFEMIVPKVPRVAALGGGKISTRFFLTGISQQLKGWELNLIKLSNTPGEAAKSTVRSTMGGILSRVTPGRYQFRARAVARKDPSNLKSALVRTQWSSKTKEIRVR